MSDPKVSVVVPIYNVESYLEKALDSLVNQTLDSLEIICVNDGSKDSSPAIIERCMARDSRIRLIDKANSGYGDSMNQGLDVATGEYVGILEPDDFLELDAFEKLYDVAVKHDADVVKANYYQHTDDGETVSDVVFENMGRLPHNTAFSALEQPGILMTGPAVWSAIYKRSYLNEKEIRFLPTPGASFQDTAFNFKALYFADRIVTLPDPFVHYRIDNAAQSSTKSLTKVYCVCDEYSEIWQYANRDLEKLDQLKRHIVTEQFSSYTWNLARLEYPAQLDFYKVLVHEFETHRLRGWIDIDLFEDFQKPALTGMLSDPEGYYRSVFMPPAAEDDGGEPPAAESDAPRDVLLVRAARKVSEGTLYRSLQNIAHRLKGC